MGETQTNFKSYVNGLKVVSSTRTEITLENGVTIEKNKCKWISVDVVAGVTYYRYDED